jgi:hypothetical protein
MKPIVLYCKTFRRDIDLVSRLIDSINKFNVDNIETYISVPAADLKLFQDQNFENVNLIEDELIQTDTSIPGWQQQQIIKSSFYKLKIADNWVCIDSDAFFIRPFYVSDFMYNDTTPYTVMHEQKELFSWTAINKHKLGFDPKLSFTEDRKKVMDVFGRGGKVYDFGPVPTIWSSKVWNDLETNYMIPNNISFEQLIEYCPSEFTWYGEALLQFKSIPIYPAEPLFKVFHYKQQLEAYQELNISADVLAQNYLGIIIQSNFTI